MTESGAVVVIDQPEAQYCASIGGIMAQRMKIRGVAGCVVGGRCRDFTELRETGLPVSRSKVRNALSGLIKQVFAKGRSTVGTGAEASVYARNIPVTISGVQVSPVSVMLKNERFRLIRQGRYRVW